MTVKSILVTHAGGMRFTAENALGHRLTMDDAEGGGGPSPIQTLLAALAGCTGMDVISILQKKRQAITAYTIETTADQRDEYPMVFTRMDVIHVIEGDAIDVTAVRRAIELSALKYCPVSAMLCAGTVELHHRYRVVTPDGTTNEGEVVVRGPGAPAVVGVE
jgi:putative redox protein